MSIFRNSEFRKRVDAGALFLIMFIWGLYLGYPMSRLQNIHGTFLGHVVPVYYFFIASPMLGAAALALTFKRNWSRWELLWWALPLICVPSILHSGDPLWSTRQWLSWVIRGVIPGGVIFLTASWKKPEPMLLRWIYPIIIAASLLGLWEIYSGHNPLWGGPNDSISGKSNPANPFYRPPAEMSLFPPMGTQGNKNPYAATLVGFLPLGLWLLKYKKRFYWANIFAVGALLSILLLAQVRAVWVGALAAVLLMRALGLQRRSRESVKLIAGILLCFGVFIAWPKTHGLLWSRLNSFHLNEESIRLRLAVLKTVGILKDQWFLGVGFGQFPMACKRYSHDILLAAGVADYQYIRGLIEQGTWTPDNQYFRWVIENGIPSFLLLFAFLFGLVRASWGKIKRLENIEQADFYKSLLVGWLSVAVTFLFFDGFYWGACDMTFWALLGLFATCLNSPEFPLSRE